MGEFSTLCVENCEASHSYNMLNYISLNWLLQHAVV